MLEWSEPLAGCCQRLRRVLDGWCGGGGATGRRPDGVPVDVHRPHWAGDVHGWLLERPRLLGTRGLCGSDTPRQRGLLRRWLRHGCGSLPPAPFVARSSAKSLSDMVMSSTLGRVRFWTRLRES